MTPEQLALEGKEWVWAVTEGRLIGFTYTDTDFYEVHGVESGGLHNLDIRTFPLSSARQAEELSSVRRFIAEGEWTEWTGEIPPPFPGGLPIFYVTEDNEP